MRTPLFRDILSPSLVGVIPHSNLEKKMRRGQTEGHATKCITSTLRNSEDHEREGWEAQLARWRGILTMRWGTRIWSWSRERAPVGKRVTPEESLCYGVTVPSFDSCTMVMSTARQGGWRELFVHPCYFSVISTYYKIKISKKKGMEYWYMLQHR